MVLRIALDAGTKFIPAVIADIAMDQIERPCPPMSAPGTKPIE
jgi:hypothetical protein